MKSHPMLFKAEMVLAQLDGSKTQTRRIVKPAPLPDGRFSGGHCLAPTKRTEGATISVEAPYVGLACPYGQPGDQPGDQLWVKETFYAFGRWETRFSTKKRRDEWHFLDMTAECGHSYSYAATDKSPLPMCGRGDPGVTPGWWKRPSLFMPRAASRITLEIVSVRVERLQDISEADARAEGADCLVSDNCDANDRALLDLPLLENGSPYRNGYALLWETINGAGSWAANPWVWVIEFSRVTP